MSDLEQVAGLIDAECYQKQEACTLLGFHTQSNEWITISRIDVPAKDINTELVRLCSQRTSNDYPWIFMVNVAVKSADFSMFKAVPEERKAISDNMKLEKGSFQKVSSNSKLG